MYALLLYVCECGSEFVSIWRAIVCTYNTTPKNSQSVPHLSLNAHHYHNGVESAFKVAFKNEMGAITQKRNFLNLPAGAVQSVHSEIAMRRDLN
jgi:hypothetical protein